MEKKELVEEEIASDQIEKFIRQKVDLEPEIIELRKKTRELRTRLTKKWRKEIMPETIKIFKLGDKKTTK